MFLNPVCFSYIAYIPCLVRKAIERKCAMEYLQDSIALMYDVCVVMTVLIVNIL